MCLFVKCLHRQPLNDHCLPLFTSSNQHHNHSFRTSSICLSQTLCPASSGFCKWGRLRKWGRTIYSPKSNFNQEVKSDFVHSTNDIQPQKSQKCDHDGHYAAPVWICIETASSPKQFSVLVVAGDMDNCWGRSCEQLPSTAVPTFFNPMVAYCWSSVEWTYGCPLFPMVDHQLIRLTIPGIHGSFTELNKSQDRLRGPAFGDDPPEVRGSPPMSPLIRQIFICENVSSWLLSTIINHQYSRVITTVDHAVSMSNPCPLESMILHCMNHDDPWLLNGYSMVTSYNTIYTHHKQPKFTLFLTITKHILAH